MSISKAELLDKILFEEEYSRFSFDSLLKREGFLLFAETLRIWAHSQPDTPSDADLLEAKNREIESLRAELADEKFKAAWFEGHQKDAARSADYWKAEFSKMTGERDEARQELHAALDETIKISSAALIVNQTNKDLRQANAALLKGLKDIAAESNDTESRYTAYRLLAQYDTARPNQGGTNNANREN